MNPNWALSLIVLADGLLWLQSAWGKVSGGKFVGALGETLGKFASNNPYPWYKQILVSTAIPNSIMVGNLVMWTELFSGLFLVGGSLYYLFSKKLNHLVRLALIAGLIGTSGLNLMFYLAAGWTSPSTSSLNLLMLVLQVVTLWTLVSPRK